MSFNADAYREAVRPWEFTAGGRTWVARPVSAPAVQAFHEAMRGAGANPRKQALAVRNILRRAFPWRLSYLVYGDPVRALFRLTMAERTEALASFFGSLEGRRPAPPAATSGTPSSPNNPIAA